MSPSVTRTSYTWQTPSVAEMDKPLIFSIFIRVVPLSYYVIRVNVLTAVSVGFVKPVSVKRIVVPP